LAILVACATPPSSSRSAVDRLVAAASTEAERQLAEDGHVDRFLVFLDADGTTSLGGIDGGGDGPGGGDVLRAMMERGDDREVTVRLSRPAIRAWRSPR
jgi:hypothetical protein